MLRFAANLTWLFTERPFLERFGAAAEAGFEGVEFLFPYDEDPQALRDALDRNGLACALFNAPPGDWEAGERGLAALPGRESDFDASIRRALDHARIVRPERIHVMAGIAGAEARATYVASLRRAAAMAPETHFSIEPINTHDMPGYHLSTSTDALAVLEAVGAANFGLQLDLYHAEIMEGDLPRRIETLASRIAHVQIAGVPHRQEPDRGELNVWHLMETLVGVGYTGWIGCEYRPQERTEDGLGWLRKWRKA